MSCTFLITVCDPLNLTLCTHIERETVQQLGLALQGQIDTLRSRSFLPSVVYTDPAPGFKAIVTLFPEIIIDTCGAQDNNVKVDIKIRRIKELCRCIKESLPWQLPKSLERILLLMQLLGLISGALQRSTLRSALRRFLRA